LAFLRRGSGDFRYHRQLLPAGAYRVREILQRGDEIADVRRSQSLKVLALLPSPLSQIHAFTIQNAADARQASR